MSFLGIVDSSKQVVDDPAAGAHSAAGDDHGRAFPVDQFFMLVISCGAEKPREIEWMITALQQFSRASWSQKGDQPFVNGRDLERQGGIDERPAAATGRQDSGTLFPMTGGWRISDRARREFPGCAPGQRQGMYTLPPSARQRSRTPASRPILSVRPSCNPVSVSGLQNLADRPPRPCPGRGEWGCPGCRDRPKKESSTLPA